MKPLSDHSLDENSRLYGSAQRGIHIADYTLQVAQTELLTLIENEGWRFDGKFDDINEFLKSVQLIEKDKLRLGMETRRKFCAAIKLRQPQASNRAIAKALGVGKGTIDRDVRGPSDPPGAEKSSKANGQKRQGGPSGPPALSGAEVGLLAQRREERKARDLAANGREQATITGEGTIELRSGDFRGVLADLRDVDAVITDPPYGKEHLALLRALAEFADRVLKKDGILAVLYGQTYLPEALAQLTGFRPYRWTACYLTPGNGYVSHARAVQSNWKPLLIFGGNEPRFSDLFNSTGDADGKEHHHWGQNFEAFTSIIERLTKPGELVVDPFTGGGTTLLAAKALGRNAIGSEINEDTVIGTRKLIINGRNERNVAAGEIHL